MLKEARCNDDEEDSVPEQDEDEDTDLSGFVVDDQADLSFHEWSEAESIPRRKTKQDAGPAQARRRLQRGASPKTEISLSPRRE